MNIQIELNNGEVPDIICDNFTHWSNGLVIYIRDENKSDIVFAPDNYRVTMCFATNQEQSWPDQVKEFFKKGGDEN